VLPDQGVARRAIDAVDSVAGHVALDPLDCVSELGENSTGCLGNLAELIACEVSRPRDISLDDEFRHRLLLVFLRSLGWYKAKPR
jgi:hypothetical protein